MNFKRYGTNKTGYLNFYQNIYGTKTCDNSQIFIGKPGDSPKALFAKEHIVIKDFAKYNAHENFIKFDSARSTISEYNRSKSSLVDFDRDPFYRNHMMKLKSVLQLFAELVIGEIMPIICAFVISMGFHALFQQRFCHLHQQRYGVVEVVVLLLLIYFWNILSSYLSATESLKVQFALSRLLSVVTLARAVYFLYQWFVTPGTHVRFVISYFVVIFYLWNIFWLGIATFYFPVPQRLVNYFTVVMSAQFGFFAKVMLTDNGLIVFILGLSMWEIISMCLPLSHSKLTEHKRGLYYSNFVGDNKELIFVGLPYEKDTRIFSYLNRNENNISNLATKKSSVQSKYRFRLALRDDRISELEQKENIVGLCVTEKYGEIAICALEDMCKKQISEGVHIHIYELMFYQCLLIHCTKMGSMVAVYSSFQLIGFCMMINEYAILFHGKSLPLSFILFILSELFALLIVKMVLPTLKHSKMSAILSFKMLQTKY